MKLPESSNILVCILLAGLLTIITAVSFPPENPTPEMNRWEYKVITVTDGYSEKNLNEQVSEMGWECLGINEGRAVFRRLVSN